MGLQPATISALQAHLPKEALARSAYQRMGNDARIVGLEGAAAYFKAASAEEHGHLQAMLDFLSAYDVRSDIPPADAQRGSVLDMQEVPLMLNQLLSTSLQLEQIVTISLSAIAETATRVNDYLMFHFIMDFIEEQDDSERELLMLLRVMPTYAGNLNDFDAFVGGLKA